MSLLARMVSRAVLGRLVLPLVAMLIAAPVVWSVRPDYPWQLVVATALAVGAMAYLVRGSFDQILRPLRPPRPQHQRKDEQAMNPAAGDPADQEQEQP